MPKRRPPREVWFSIREQIWQRDHKICVRCRIVLALTECHIDHIHSGKLGTNQFRNLRTLCRRCHVLRSCHRHQGMIASALRDGVIPANWRELVWDELRAAPSAIGTVGL
jgi:5-methylcytosine-specific restriction protein A